MPGGARWRGAAETVRRANLWLRTASRVVVRLGEFRARGFAELERQARRLRWNRFADQGTPVVFRVTSKKSRLYHTGAIAERLADAVERATGARGAAVADPAEENEDGDGAGSVAQRFVVRFHRDVCTISADSSGELLHRRGYRQAVGKAPLRETLAAAMLLGSGWEGGTPVLDPLCGSGTIPIEAALLARRIAPGLHRRFAFERWPEHDQRGWAAERSDAEAVVLPSSPVVIQASDRDAGAIAAAAANAERAGVRADVELSVRAVSAMEPSPGPGLLVANPPYGERIGDVGALRDLYAQLGHVARRRCPGWTLAILSPDPRLDAELRLPLAERFHTVNGGIPVRLVTAIVEGVATS